MNETKLDAFFLVAQFCINGSSTLVQNRNGGGLLFKYKKMLQEQC